MLFLKGYLLLKPIIWTHLTHNTGLAKLFDTLYSDNIPPKEFDSRVRTTVYGYPVALFHRLNPTDGLDL